MTAEGGWSCIEDDWAKISSEDVEDDKESSCSSAEVIMDKEPSRFMIRRHSTDSVEVMSMENDDCVAIQDDESTNGGSLLTQSTVSLSAATNNMCCSCSTIMNQSTMSIVHIRLEEVETQTEETGTENPTTKSDADNVMSASQSGELHESQLERTLDSIAEYIHRHGHQLIFIPSHLLFAVLVLTGCYLAGIVRVDLLERNTSAVSNDPSLASLNLPAVTTHSTVTVTGQNSQTSQSPIRELQSPEWLDRLSSLLDDVSDELVAVDAQVSNVERQLEQFDLQLEKNPHQSVLGGAKSQLFILDAYRQLVEKQRVASRLLDRLNSVLDVDRHSSHEMPALLDVRLRLVDVAGDLVALNSRMTEVALANKHRHINMVKKATSDRHRMEAAYLQSLVERIRLANAGQYVPGVDATSTACRRLLQPSNHVASHLDLVDCLIRSRMALAEIPHKMNLSLEYERKESMRHRQRALVAERTLSDLREELDWLYNRTIYLQNAKRQQSRQLEEAKPREIEPRSVMQCLANNSPASSGFSDLLRQPEFCSTRDSLEAVAEKFAVLLSRIAAGRLDGTWNERSTRALLDMLSSTFTTLTKFPTKPQGPPRPPPRRVLPVKKVGANPVLVNTTSTLHGSFTSALMKAYDRLKRSVVSRTSVFRSLLEDARTRQCQRAEEEARGVEMRIASLQHDRKFYDAAVLNSLFEKASVLNRLRSCLSPESRAFLDCQLIWANRMMRLFRGPFCSDALPLACFYQPWQHHLMASIEMTSSWFMEQASNSTRKEVPKKVDYGPPPPRWWLANVGSKIVAGKKGDDGVFEGSCDARPTLYVRKTPTVKDIVIVRRRGESCRLEAGGNVSSMPHGPQLPHVINLPSVFPRNEEDIAQICRNVGSGDRNIASKQNALATLHHSTAISARIKG